MHTQGGGYRILSELGRKILSAPPPLLRDFDKKVGRHIFLDGALSLWVGRRNDVRQARRSDEVGKNLGTPPLYPVLHVLDVNSLQTDLHSTNSAILHYAI